MFFNVLAKPSLLWKKVTSKTCFHLSGKATRGFVLFNKVYYTCFYDIFFQLRLCTYDGEDDRPVTCGGDNPEASCAAASIEGEPQILAVF